MDPEELAEACGDRPSWICEWVFEQTESDGIAGAADFLFAKPLKILFVLLGALIVYRVLRRIVRRSVERIASGTPSRLAAAAGAPLDDLRSRARADTIGQVLGSLVGVLVLLVASLLVLGELGINLAPLIAGAGIAGIAIGFGAQSLVKDFLAGFFIIVEDQYGVGDTIDVGEASGTVEAVTLRSTRLRDVAGTVWHVPNGTIERVGNQSQRWARALIDVKVASGTDLRDASRLIKEVSEAFARDEAWSDQVLDVPEVLGLEGYEAGAASIRVSVRTQPGMQWGVGRELRLRIYEALGAAGVDVAPAVITATRQA